jgi:endoglucanase
MVMPGVTKAPRYVVQKGTAATLDFAAVMAQASRILQRFKTELPGLSDSCLKAAVLAWQWAVKNPAMGYDQDAMNKQFQPAVTTGGYGDWSFLDEWYWAAVELYVTTGKDVYAEQVKRYSSAAKQLPGWPNVGMAGDFTLLRFAKKLPLAKELGQPLRDVVLKMADELISLSGKNAFATVIGGRGTDFIWGSNAVAANQGWLLVNAFFITGKKTYLDHALANLDYLLGRNATGYCFVTGMGSGSTMHPHHRPSVADGIMLPVPGLLAGGPNALADKQDKCAYVFKEPETMYVDNDCSYASNEIAINWNAPLVYLSAAMEVLYREK